MKAIKIKNPTLALILLFWQSSDKSVLAKATLTSSTSSQTGWKQANTLVALSKPPYLVVELKVSMPKMLVTCMRPFLSSALLTPVLPEDVQTF